MKKVGYDGQALLSANGGTGKGQHLQTLLGPFRAEFLGFASAEPNPLGLPLIQEGRPGYTLWQQLSLPGSLKRHGVEVFLSPYNTAPLLLSRSIRLVLVLHDLILMEPYRKSAWKHRMLDAYRRWLIGPSVRRAEVVLTVSQYARGEILKRFPAADVRVISCTVPQAWFAPRPLEGRKGYLLMTTSSAPHKNAPGAIQAYVQYSARAGAAARPLRVVGMSKQAGKYNELLTQAGLRDQVSFLPFLSETELIAQYQDAAALLFPSFSEGFGIPMLEAMATGTPILAANAASLPEVGGQAARYFDPRDLDEMASVMLEVLGDDAERHRMAQQGFVELERYTPERVGAEVDAFWQEIAAAGSTRKAKPELCETVVR